MSPRTSPAGSRAADLEQANLPLGLIVAVVLHVAIAGAMLVTWTHTLDIADQSPPVVPVDLVTLADKTNIKAMTKLESKAPPKEEQVAPPTPEPAPQPTPAPQPQQEEAAPPPDLSTVPIPKKPPPPPQKDKPQPEKKSKVDEFDSMLAMLDKRAPQASAAPKAQTGPRTIKGIGEQNAMNMDLVDSLRNQIAQCWSPPVGAPHPETLIVSFELFLQPDGSVAQAPQLIGSPSGSGFAKAAEDSARRAIYTCAPYRLPPERYSQWRDINLTFDPRQMAGQ